LTAYPNRRGEDADLPPAGAGRTMAQKELITLTNDSALIRAAGTVHGRRRRHVVSDMRTLSDELLQPAPWR
jgi:hypothetical protein